MREMLGKGKIVPTNEEKRGKKLTKQNVNIFHCSSAASTFGWQRNSIRILFFPANNL
jgi:hypothetical protein